METVDEYLWEPFVDRLKSEDYVRTGSPNGNGYYVQWVRHGQIMLMPEYPLAGETVTRASKVDASKYKFFKRYRRPATEREIAVRERERLKPSDFDEFLLTEKNDDDEEIGI